MSTAGSILQASDRADALPKSLMRLRNFYNVKDTNLAAHLGISRQSVANKLKGVTPITARELAIFSMLFGVPIDVLYEGPSATIRWVLDHPGTVSDLLVCDSLCSSRSNNYVLADVA